MEVLEAIAQRQSCRNYLEQPVELEKLSKLVEAAGLAPSAVNSQPWSFVVISQPENVAKARACILESGMNKFCEKVPAFIAVVEEPAYLRPNMPANDRYSHGDMGMAVENLCLAATGLGLSTCIMGAFGPENKMKELLGLSQEKKLRLVVAVGYADPSDPLRPKKRKALDEICKFL